MLVFVHMCVLIIELLLDMVIKLQCICLDIKSCCGCNDWKDIFVVVAEKQND